MTQSYARATLVGKDFSTHTHIYTHAYKMYIWTHAKHVSELKLRSTSSAETNFADEITWITWKTEQNLEIWPFLNSRLEMWVWRGDGSWGKKAKKKISAGTQPKARAGWPKRLRLVQATPWADFAVITAQLWSTMTAIFPWVNNFAFNYYSRPRF